MLVQFLNNKKPILHIDDDGFGLNRDRNPDNGWGQLVRTRLDSTKITNIDISLVMNIEYKIILLEDLAYVYGNNTNQFRNKLIEFGLV